MSRTLLVLLGLALAGACGPTMQTVHIVNGTDRTITEFYVYPAGAAERGASKGKLAPGARTSLKVAEGNVDVLAVSERVQLDETSTEMRTASQTIELTGPLELVFHDSNKRPPGLGAPNTRGIAFRVDTPVPPPTPPEPTEGMDPADTAPE
jgi:hypothetical protein